MSECDIIIVTVEGETDTIACLDSVRKFTKNYKIVWVDNGSPAASRMKVLGALKGMEYLSIWLSGNTGFVNAVNHAIPRCSAPYVCLLHNDTLVTPGWLDRLRTGIDKGNQMACSGPMTDDPALWQGWTNIKGKMFNNMPDFDIKDPAMVSELAVERFKSQIKPVNSVSMFCALFKRGVFADHGLLDPAFGSGPREGDDYCARLREGKHKVMFCPAAFVFHAGGGTFKRLMGEAGMRAVAERNAGIYKERWPADK